MTMYFAEIKRGFFKSLMYAGMMLLLVNAVDAFPAGNSFLAGNELNLYDSSLVILKEFPLDIESPSSGVQFYKDGIIFLSWSKNMERMSSKHLSFGILQTFYGVLQDTVLGRISEFVPGNQFSFPSEAVTFDSGFSDMYFTKISDEDGLEKIFHAVFSEEDQVWHIDDNPVEFCRMNEIYTHPALSGGGDLLVFASRKPGSISGMDLYLVRKQEDGWSEPQPCLPSINSNGNELFPFLDKNNNLFFSSDGLPGYGGYDVYCSRYNGESWDQPVNLTRTINSNLDEIAFKLDMKNEQTGFLSIKYTRPDNMIRLTALSLSDQYLKSGVSLADLLVNLALLEGDKLADNTEQIKTFPEPGPMNKGMNEKDTLATGTDSPDTTASLKPEPVSQDNTILSYDKELLQTTRRDSIEFTEDQQEEVKDSIVAEQAEEQIPEAEQTGAEPGNVENIIYRVQYASSSKARGSQTISIGGLEYKTWEYLYKGAYRSCVGEFATLSEAKAMQAKCRQSGYPQAFVVVFVNNERSLDPALFK